MTAMFSPPLLVSALLAALVGFVSGVVATAVFLRLRRRRADDRVDRIVGEDEDLAKLRDQIKRTVDRRIRRFRREEDRRKPPGR